MSRGADEHRARLELLRELAAVEATLRRARLPAIVLHHEMLIDALLEGFAATTTDLIRRLQDGE